MSQMYNMYVRALRQWNAIGDHSKPLNLSDIPIYITCGLISEQEHPHQIIIVGASSSVDRAFHCKSIDFCQIHSCRKSGMTCRANTTTCAWKMAGYSGYGRRKQSCIA